jgi:hypothetical protein
VPDVRVTAPQAKPSTRTVTPASGADAGLRAVPETRPVGPATANSTYVPAWVTPLRRAPVVGSVEVRSPVALVAIRSTGCQTTRTSLRSRRART